MVYLAANQLQAFHATYGSELISTLNSNMLSLHSKHRAVLAYATAAAERAEGQKKCYKRKNTPQRSKTTSRQEFLKDCPPRFSGITMEASNTVAEAPRRVDKKSKKKPKRSRRKGDSISKQQVVEDCPQRSCGRTVEASNTVASQNIVKKSKKKPKELKKKGDSNSKQQFLEDCPPRFRKRQTNNAKSEAARANAKTERLSMPPRNTQRSAVTEMQKGCPAPSIREMVEATGCNDKDMACILTSVLEMALE